MGMFIMINSQYLNLVVLARAGDKEIAARKLWQNEQFVPVYKSEISEENEQDVERAEYDLQPL